METAPSSVLDGARDLLKQRDEYKEKLLLELKEAEARVNEIKDVIAALVGAVDVVARDSHVESPRQRANGKPVLLRTKGGFDPSKASNPEVIAHIVGQYPDGIDLGDLVTEACSIRPKMSRPTAYTTAYRMASDGRLRQSGRIYFLAEKEAKP